jgi:hypothetical protein
MARKAIVLLLGFFIFALMAPQPSNTESMLTRDVVDGAQGYKIYWRANLSPQERQRRPPASQALPACKEFARQTGDSVAGRRYIKS